MRSSYSLYRQYMRSHGMKGTRFYGLWQKIKRACYNEKYSGYHLYGGSGISMCEEWEEYFRNFMDDMYESYLQHAAVHGEENTCLEIFDGSKQYSVFSCRWYCVKEAIDAQAYTNSTTGIRGVSYHKGSGKYEAKIRRAGNRKHLGYHETPGEAYCALQEYYIDQISTAGCTIDENGEVVLPC